MSSVFEFLPTQNQLTEQDLIEAIDFGYEAVCELIKAQQTILKESGIKQQKIDPPTEETTIPAYLDKNCTKSIGEILKQFEQTKEERDTKLESFWRCFRQSRNDGNVSICVVCPISKFEKSIVEKYPSSNP